MKNTPKLIISPELVSTITYLHSKCENTEWSGILYYTIDSGNVDKPESLVMTAKKICLMDVGSGVSTSFNYDDGTLLADFIDDNIEVLDYRMGLIHTHHNMEAYFSGTDLDELKDNTSNYDFYLSLIVNFNGKYCAKISTAAEIEIQLRYKNGMVKNKTIKDIVDIDCDIVLENHVGDVVDKLLEKKQVPAIKDYIYKGYDNITGYNNNAYIPNIPIISKNKSNFLIEDKKYEEFISCIISNGECLTYIDLEVFINNYNKLYEEKPYISEPDFLLAVEEYDITIENKNDILKEINSNNLTSKFSNRVKYLINKFLKNEQYKY